MDFHGMKRKQLQALCKKHGVLANKSNAEMADLLTLTLKANKNPITEGHGELPNKNDSMNVPKKSKKVRFSPDVETREYEPSMYKGKKTRSMVNSEKVNGSPPRARSRVRKKVERNAEEVVLSVVGKKRGSGGGKEGSLGVENVDAIVVTEDGGAQLVKGGDKLRRHLRSREVVIERNVEGGAVDLVASRKNSKRGMSGKRRNSERSNGNALLDEISVGNVSAKDDAKPAKKVRFSPDVETREYEPSMYKGKKRSMVNSEKANGSPPRARSRERRTVEKNVEEVVLTVVGKKRGSGGEKKGSLGVENVDATVVTEDGGPQLVKGGDKLRRQLRSRRVVIERNVEGGEGDLVASRKNSKKGISRKRWNNEGSNGNALLDEVSVENVSSKDDAKPANIPLRPRRNARKKETTSLLTVELGETEIVGRITRSRAKSENNTSSVTENKAETFEVQDECQKVLQIEESLKGVGSYALRRKSFVPQKGVAEEILTEEGVEARKGHGRSRRNARKKEGTSFSSGDFGKTDIVGRITRSRCSKVGENTSSVTTNKSETIEIPDEREKVLQLEEPLKGLDRFTLRRKSMVPQKGVAVESVSGEGLESIKNARPSKRNTVKATDSKPIIEVVVSRRTRFGAQVAGNNCAVESADEDTKDNKEQNRAVQLKESLKAQSRNVSRQKSVTAQNGKVESEGPDVNSETRKLSRNAVLKAVNEVEASVQSRGKTEKALVPIGHLRRSRRNTVLSSSTFDTDELGIVKAAGKVGQQKQKCNPMLGEDASPVAGKCLVDTPSRQSAQHASKSDLVASTVPGKIVEKKQQSISALPVIVQEAMFTEETQIEQTRLALSEVTGDKVNFSLNCGKEVFKTSDKGSDSKPGEMRRTSFSEVSAVFSDFLEGGVDAETNLQETSSPTSTSTSLTLLSASANQEMPENASQPAVINDEANIVVGDMEKLVADVIPDVGADDLSCRSTEGGADFVNCNSDELGVAELHTNASDMLSLASGFSSANQSDFSGLEKGLERKELGEDIHLENGDDANDGSTEIDRTSALDDGVCDLEKAGLNVTIKRKEHEEAPCDDRASPAAGEGMVSLSTEINLQEDGDFLLTQAAEEEQNFISERNSGHVSWVSGVCDLEKAGLDVTTNTNEHEEPPCVDRASLSAGEGMVSLSTEINLQEDGEVLYIQAAEKKQNFISGRNSAFVSQVSGVACTHDLLDGEGTCLSAPEDGTNGSENRSAATVPLQFTVIGKHSLSFSAGDSSLDRNIRHHDEKACEDEKHVLNLEKKEATADAQPQSSLKELQDKEKDSFAVTPHNCIAEITGETEVTIRGDSGKPSTGVNSLLTLSEELSGYKEMIEIRNCRLDATIDVPISKFHEAAMDMVSGRNMDRESDVEIFETKEEESGCAVTTEHDYGSGCQKMSAKVDANADSGFTHIISEEREGSEGKTVDMMGHSNDFHISSIEMVSDKNMTRNPCDHVVGKETAKGALLFEHWDHRGSEEVAANLNGIADASLTPTIEKCETREEESGCAVTTEHGDDSGSQKVSAKLDANADSGFTYIISEEREGSEGKTVDMMGHSNDFNKSSKDMVSGKNMTRDPCDHVVGKETAKGALLFELCDHRSSEEVAASLNGIADGSLTPTIEKCETKEEESGCAVTTEHGDDSGSQKVSAKVDANADSGFTHTISEEREGSEGKTVDMMGHSNDFHISSKEMVSGKSITGDLCDHVVGKKTAKGALLFELCDHSSSVEVAANLNGIADGSLTPTIENCETKEEESGCAVATEHGDGSGSQKVSAKVDANADSGFTHLISEEREGSEGKSVDMMGHSNDFHISSKEMVSGKNMTRDLCDHVVGKETAKVALLFELCDHRSSEEMATNLNGIADASLTPHIYKEIEISRGKNVGWGENSSKSRKRTNMWTDQETVSVGNDSNADTASADIEDRDDTSDGVMDAELELGVEAGEFDNLEELNALGRESNASIAIENRNSMDVIAAFTKENVVKLEDDLKLKRCNIDDEKEYSIIALPQATPKGMTEHSVEEELHEINEGCDAVPNDSSKNIEVEADEAGSVAIGRKICFEKVEDCNNWTERTAISPQILESSRKKAKQTSSEQKLLAGLYSGTFRMGSSTDAVSELNVLLSHDAGEKYKSHPGSKSISTEAGGKAMASSDKELLTGSDASAFTDWEVNLIQGNREQDQVLFTHQEVHSIQESDGEGLIDNLISNNSEHAAWVVKNVEEVLFTDREVNLIQGSGEQDQAEESGDVASRDNLKSNDPLDEHAADDAIRDLKADDISYPDIQETCETGLGAIDNVGIATAEKMDILEEVGIRGTSHPVIPAEASHETAKGTLLKAFLSCSKPDESTSSEQLVFDGTSRGLPEIISVGSVVRQNGPVAYEGGFVPQLYCKDMRSHGGEETTCDHRGSNPPEQGDFHQGDCEVLIAHTIGAEEAREALNDATGDTSLESNPTDPQVVATKDANEHPDEVNEPALMVGLDCVLQNQQLCQCEKESHPIETEAAAHCLHKLDDGVFSEEIVDFGNGLVTSLINYQRDVDSSAGSSVSASQHHITENDPWELNLFFRENEQYENQTSDAWFLNSNLRNKDARKVEANIVGTEQAAIQVVEEQHGELAQVMDEQIEEAKHTFFAVSDEPLFEDAEASKKQDCVPLEVDSIQDCINCENYENKSENAEHSDGSAEKEILIDVAEFNSCYNAVSSEQRVERNPSYSKQHNNENPSVEDAGITTDLSVDVSFKPDVDMLDQSFEITNSAVGQDIAVGDDETRQLKLPLPQKTTSCAKEEESHSSDAKQLNTSLVKRKISKTGFVQATPQKMVTCTHMKENLTSNKREQRSHMTAPNALSKRRALENLRNN